MSKSLNIRIEKKPGKYIGPKVVNIHQYKVNWYKKNFEKLLRDYNQVIIIGRGPKNVELPEGQVYTSLEKEELLWALEQAKQAIL